MTETSGPGCTQPTTATEVDLWKDAFLTALANDFARPIDRAGLANPTVNEASRIAGAAVEAFREFLAGKQGGGSPEADTEAPAGVTSLLETVATPPRA